MGIGEGVWQPSTFFFDKGTPLALGNWDNLVVVANSWTAQSDDCHGNERDKKVVGGIGQ